MMTFYERKENGVERRHSHSLALPTVSRSLCGLDKVEADRVALTWHPRLRDSRHKLSHMLASSNVLWEKEACRGDPEGHRPSPTSGPKCVLESHQLII